MANDYALLRGSLQNVITHSHINVKSIHNYSSPGYGNFRYYCKWDHLFTMWFPTHVSQFVGKVPTYTHTCLSSKISKNSVWILDLAIGIFLFDVGGMVLLFHFNYNVCSCKNIDIYNIPRLLLQCASQRNYLEIGRRVNRNERGSEYWCNIPYVAKARPLRQKNWLANYQRQEYYMCIDRATSMANK